MEYFAIGSDLRLGTGTSVAAPGTITSAGCVISQTPNTITRSFSEVRPCLNATDRTVKKRPTTVDFGTFAVRLRFAETLWNTLEGYLTAGTKKPVFEVLGDTGKAFGAMCYVETMGVPELNEEGEVEINVTFMLDSEFDLVAAPAVGGGA